MHKPPAEAGEARVGADQLDRLATVGTDRLGLGFEQRSRDTDTGDRTHAGEHVLRKAVGVAGEQLQAGVAHDPTRELGDRALQACVDTLGGKQQGDAGGNPDHREALLHEASAQAQAVEVQGVGELIGRDGDRRRLGGAVCGGLPSRRPYTRSAYSAAIGSWETSTTATPRSRPVAQQLEHFPSALSVEAAVGSSASSIEGLVERARAIITRWRSPIESVSER